MPLLNPFFQKEVNKLDKPAYVTLYIVDLSKFGGPVYRFCNSPKPDGNPVMLNGQAYPALPCLGDGFDATASGQLPKPTLTVGNVGKTVQASVLQYGDCVGAPVTRIRIWEKHLDGGSEANNAAFLSDKWLIEKIVLRNAEGIQWQLTTELDRLSFRAGRQILKDKSQRNIYAPGVSRNRIR